MQLIKWSYRYEGGVELIDQQHLKLVELINSLHDAMMLGRGVSVLHQVFEELIVYTKYHFDTEEDWMEENGYLDLQAHKEMHNELSKKVLRFQKEYESGVMNSAVITSNFLNTWLIDHIVHEDIKVMSLFNKKSNENS